MVVRADGKDELSGWEALADIGFGNHLVGLVSLAERGTWKVRLSGCGGSRRRPTVVSRSPCRTGKPRCATGSKR